LLVEQIAEHTDSIDILVNNAGAAWGAPLEEYPESGWDRVMDLNVKGVFNMTRFLRPMLDKAAAPGDPSRVINISSIDATMVPLSRASCTPRLRLRSTTSPCIWPPSSHRRSW
jgi:NAD(P)-dependent dehydrogenase (short-subunit alcohol dehydrogenase family)